MAKTDVAPRRRVRLVVGGTALVLALVTGAFVATTAFADGPSDPRATFVDGNVQTCADMGFGAANVTQLDSGGGPQPSGTVTEDADVSVTVSDHVPEGQELNIVNKTGVIILGTAVKGGSAYNLYPGTVLNALVAPFVGQSNNFPGISHWILCHDPGTPPDDPADPVPGAPRFTG